MPPIRTLTTPNDFGPRTVTRTRLSHNGLGARLVVRGNPYSFLADWVTPCLPFQSLAGGQSAASKAVRANALGGLTNDPGSGVTIPGTDPTPAPAATPGAPASTPAAAPNPAPAASGPFPYIAIAHPGK